MGIFKQKQSGQQNDDLQIFDDELRDELRAMGREHFEKVLSENAAHFKQDLDMTIAHVGSELKDYMTKQLDSAMAHFSEQMNNQLHQRLSEYDRVTKDAHDLAVQSLNRSAHTLHEQYEQFNSALQKSVSGQEATMLAAYNDNKAQLAEIKKVQDQALDALNASIRVSEKQRTRLTESLEKASAEQDRLLKATFDETQARIDATRESQDAALQTLNNSARALEEEYQQLRTSLQEKIDARENLMVDAFQDNMARIIEHYLLAALSDQYDMKAQLPMIIKQMEDNKQAIVDDMKS